MEFDISGARIFFRIPTGIPILGDFLVTETLVVSWIVMAIITGLCIFLTRDLKVEKISKRQAAAEMIVDAANNLVRNNTGGTKFDKLIPFVAALFATSIVSNLISLTGILRSPTADLSTEAAWAVVVFIMITTEFQHSLGAGDSCQYGMPSLRQYFVRCRHKRIDLRGACRGVFRSVGADPRRGGRFPEPYPDPERRHTCDHIVLF